MHAALWLPRFHLQAVLRQTGALRSSLHGKSMLALLDESEAGSRDKEFLLHVSAAVEKLGVHPGMTASQAQARCPALVFLHRDAVLETQAQQELLQCASLWTPDYEATLPGFCVMDLQRHPRIKGREHESGRQMCAYLKARSLDAQVGFALNADLATLAAQAAEQESVLVLRNETETQQFLHQLPVRSLRPSAEALRVLSLWGIHTLRDLMRLPRNELASRLGPEGRLLHDMASGGRERLLKLVRPPLEFHDETDLEHPIECLDPLLFVLRRMLQGLCERLADVWLVAAAMWLMLRFEDDTEHRHELNVAEPTRDTELLFRVLHIYLEGLTAAAPIKLVRLEIRPTRPSGQQGLLFERALRDPNRFSETLSQLEALLGIGNVGRAVLQPSRRTDAFEVVSFMQSSPQSLVVHSPAGLPLRRLRPSPDVWVNVEQGRPARFVHDRQERAIVASDGPWLLSGDWWDAGRRWEKEVWAVQADDGVLYQLARQHHDWVLEGTLG